MGCSVVALSLNESLSTKVGLIMAGVALPAHSPLEINRPNNNAVRSILHNNSAH